MQDFIYEVSTRILFGDKLKKLPEEVKKYANRVLLTYGGGSIKKSGLYDEIIKMFEENNIFYKELSGIEPNPRIESVREGLKISS